jgi:uncharacterized protein (TIGR02284 family)
MERQMEKAIDILNSLIVINNDRIEGYETASGETEDTDLISLFSKCILNSEKCRQELILEVNRLGGDPEEGTLTSGKIFRAWMDIKAALTSKDRESVLNSCEFGEDEAQDTYEEALEVDSEYLSAEQLKMIMSQQSLLKADHDQIKALRDVQVDA